MGFLSAVGFGLLILSATRMAGMSEAVAFVGGTACGYLTPLGLRLVAVVGQERVRGPGLVRWGLLALIAVPLVAAAASFALLALRVAQSFAIGVLAMVMLGVALVREDGAS